MHNNERLASAQKELIRKHDKLCETDKAVDKMAELLSEAYDCPYCHNGTHFDECKGCITDMKDTKTKVIACWRKWAGLQESNKRK